MNNNLIIGILAVIILVGGGIWLMNSGGPSGTTATSTPTTNTQTTTTTTSTASAPKVTTGTLIVATNSTAIVTGEIVPNGAQTSYWYEYGETKSFGSRTNAQNIGSGYVSISAPAYITGLKANTSYNFRLVGENSFGIVNDDTLSFTTNSNPPVAGTAPTMQTDAATSVTRTSANLNGRVNPNGSNTSYWFEYGNSSSLGNTTSFQTTGAGNTSLSVSLPVSGLAPATKYYFRMDAQNRFGTMNGTILVFTTPGPSAATAPSANTTNATSITASSAKLNGAVNPNGDSTSYWFEYGAGSTLATILGSTLHSVVTGSGTTPVNVSIELTGITPNTTYSYRLVTMNTYGTVRGDIVSFKTKQR